MPPEGRVEALRWDLTESPHLDFDAQLVPYVDGRLRGDARRDVESHLAGCNICRREVAELRPLAVARRGVAVRRRITAGLAAAAVLVVVAAAVLYIVQQQQTAPPGVRTPAAGLRKSPPARALRDGSRVIAVDAAGTLSGVSLDAMTAARIAAVLEHPELVPPAVLSSLSFPKAGLRGETAGRDLAVLAPLGTVMLDARPRFAWRGTPGQRYSVSVVDESQHRSRGETTETEWTPPADLPRGYTYTWQVSTTIAGRTIVAPAPPDPEAQFRIVDERTATAIEAARREKGHLVAGVLAYDAGAIAEARLEFGRVAADNPASTIPRQLIESCDRALRR